MYTNSRIADRLFSRSSKQNIISVVEWEHQIVYKSMFHLYESLKTNTNAGLKEFQGDEATLYERLTHHSDLEKIFQDAMQSISLQAIHNFAEYIDFSKVKMLVDIGGGNGTNIITLAKKNPGLKAKVFDSPTVCEIAKTNIESHGLSNRLGVVNGDCFADEFPKGVDTFLFAHFFTIWSKEKDKKLLKKSYQALPHGGRVIIFNMMQKDNETGPWSAAGGSAYFQTLATGEGMLYTANEYETWMKEAGFSKVQRIKLPKDHAAIIGIK